MLRTEAKATTLLRQGFLPGCPERLRQSGELPRQSVERVGKEHPDQDSADLRTERVE